MARELAEEAAPLLRRRPAAAEEESDGASLDYSSSSSTLRGARLVDGDDESERRSGSESGSGGIESESGSDSGSESGSESGESDDEDIEAAHPALGPYTTAVGCAERAPRVMCLKLPPGRPLAYYAQVEAWYRRGVVPHLRIDVADQAESGGGDQVSGGGVKRDITTGAAVGLGVGTATNVVDGVIAGVATGVAAYVARRFGVQYARRSKVAGGGKRGRSWTEERSSSSSDSSSDEDGVDGAEDTGVVALGVPESASQLGSSSSGSDGESEEEEDAVGGDAEVLARLPGTSPGYLAAKRVALGAAGATEWML